MTISRRPRLRRITIGLGLLCLSLALGGCVYLRLLQLKNQLAEFDRYIETDLRDGLKLTFKKPVLLDEDVEGFFKWIPESRERLNTAEKWHFRWLKERVAADGDGPPYATELDLVFTGHKVAKMIISESFFAAVLPKNVALGLIRSLGRAKIDQKNRSAMATADERDFDPNLAEPPLTRDGVTKLLGAPNHVTEDATRPQWHYHFVGAAHQQMGRGGDIVATFTFNAATGRVRELKGETPWGQMSVGFEEKEEPVPAGGTDSKQ